MIDGAHIILYSRDPEADRAFFRDVLRFDSVDAGHGWLIFALPPAEAAFHGLEKQRLEEDDEDRNDLPEKARHELYFMCDDITATLDDLKKKKVPVSAVNEQRWGSIATLTLPSGGKVGIYEPKHPKPKHL
jgi:catechol 2,3-dioxygenase-like lactoylglutathione lyase family enzyme